jgi:predicted TPR repeat methyltransferase
MNPTETAHRYDKIARWWQENVPDSYGLAALERALRFAPKGGVSLDVGCGSQGRFMRVLREHGFQTEGMDVSVAMIELARERDPASRFYTADIAAWELPKKYDFISAWDSTFHLPLDLQEPVLRKLCGGLMPGGILLFTCGGGEAGAIRGSFQGQEFGYSTLGVEAFVSMLAEAGCRCRHVEYDQYPEKHVVVIAEKKPAPESHCGR